MCGVVISPEKEVLLREIGVKDSKLLLPKKREELYEKIMKIADGIHVVIVEPSEIDDALADPYNNLNKLEAQKSAEIILELKPDKAILDCPSPNLTAYTEEVQKTLGDFDVKIISSHKADLRFPVVSAASIIAKCTRDRIVNELKEKHNVDFGSGYMSDPKTTIFLEENWNDEEYAYLFRKSWASWKKIKVAQGQMKLAEY
jgi:ribonuclease HII